MSEARLGARGWASLLAALPFACATPAAGDAALPLAVPAQFGVGGAAAGAPATDGLALEPWWDAFADADLDRHVRAALAGNRDLAAAAERVASARAVARAIAGARLPQVGAGLELSRARRNLIGLPIPGAPEVLPITASQHGLGLDLAWEWDLWDRLSAAERAAAADAEAVEAERRAFGLSLSGQTARSWLTLAHQEEWIALLVQREQLATEVLALARRRFAAGAGSAGAVPRAEAALAQLRAHTEQERAARGAAAAELDRLCGRIAGGAAAAARLPAAPAPLPPDLPAEMLARRPDLAASAARVAAARARADEAEAALLPRLQLTASGGTVSEALGDLLDGDFRVWGLAAGLTAPIFQGGRLQAQSESAAALARAAEADHVARALLAFAECESALAADQRLREAHARALEAVAAREREWAAARRRHADGPGDAAEVLALADALLEARGAALGLRYALLLDRVDLFLALGGAAGPPAQP